MMDIITLHQDRHLCEYIFQVEFQTLWIFPDIYTLIFFLITPNMFVGGFEKN